jgi:plasmid stabilization system protein ParE
VTISFSPEAEEDLVAVVSYLAERNPAAARELGQRVFSVLDRLVAGEFEGIEQTLRSGDVVRSWPVPPVRIYYQRRGEGLWVLRIYHQARPPIVR